MNRGLAIIGALALFAASLEAQATHVAPRNAPSAGRLAPVGEPGTPLSVSGIVVSPQGDPVAGASLYAFQTDHEGYYGVKPVSDNQNPRLKILLRTDSQGRWAFETIRPGSYPNSRAPGHIHFEVSAPGFATRVFEIVFEGDPFITAQMRTNPAFSVRPIENGRVRERIVLMRNGPVPQCLIASLPHSIALQPITDSYLDGVGGGTRFTYLSSQFSVSAITCMLDSRAE
jgi:protocatechuate 3,4-dioxygenase beta subunit